MAQSGTNSPDTSVRGGPLDMLRFLAAGFVVLYHFAEHAPVALDRLAPVIGRGWLATDFFLMLSGFVLGGAYGPKLDQGRMPSVSFFARRLARVWPGQLIVLVALLALVSLCALAGVQPHHPERFEPGDFFAQAALIQAWGFGSHLSWNAPSWTLSALVVCYAAFPFAWRAAKGLEGRPAALFCALDVLALAALTARLTLGHAPWDLGLGLAMVRAVPLFLCGLLLARAASGLKLKGREPLWVAGAGALALILFQASGHNDLADLGSMVAIAFVVLAAGSASGPRSALAARGATLSFALFVTHTLSAAVWFGALGAVEARWTLAEPLRWAGFLGAFAFAFAVAWTFDRFVDQPIQRGLKAAMGGGARTSGVKAEA